MAKTVEEILEALRAIVDGAEGRDLTEEEAQRYEQLETELATARRSEEIRKRHAAYETPVRQRSVDAVVHTGAAKADDTLERAFEAYLRTGQPNQDIMQLRAQSAGTDSEGGFLVPDGFRQKLVEVRKAFGGLASQVETINTSTGSNLEYPTLDDTANAGTITGEGAQFTGGDDLVFGSVNLGAYKYTSSGDSDLPLRVSVELLQDAAFDVQGLVTRALGTRIARKQASDWAVGTGSGMPYGIAHAGLTADVNLATSDTITYEDLLAAEAALDPAYEQSAVWVMSKATWSAIRGLTDANDRPLIQPEGTSGIGTAPARTLLGYPVVIDQAMPAYDDDAGVHFAVFGDLREAYVIRRVSNLAVVVNPWSRANYGQVEYVAWERADGNIQNRSAYVVLANAEASSD